MMQYLIETDILLDFLGHRAEVPSVLRHALACGRCYTTMLNAMEVYAEMTNEAELTSATNMFLAVRVLGFSGRFAAPFAELTRGHSGISKREMLVLGMAHTSNLVILTRAHYDRYAALGIASVVSHAEREVPMNLE